MQQKKKKINLTSVLIVLLFLLGAGIMLYPTASDLYFKWSASREISQYYQVAEAEQEDYSELWAAAEAYNRQLAEHSSFAASVTDDDTTYVSQFLNPLGTGMMGYLDIPAIEIHIPIYQGTDESVLQSGAGYWIGTSLPTGGESTHCVLTAHNGLVKAKLFTDLDQLETGDTFSLSILNRELTYEIDQILIAEPDDFEPLEIVEGEDYVTLYTCYPYGVNTNRLLVRGHRVETLSAAPVDVSAPEPEPGRNNLLWIGIAAGSAVLLLVLAGIWIDKHRYHGKREQSRKRKAK